MKKILISNLNSITVLFEANIRTQKREEKTVGLRGKGLGWERGSFNPLFRGLLLLFRVSLYLKLYFLYILNSTHDIILISYLCKQKEVLWFYVNFGIKSCFSKDFMLLGIGRSYSIANCDMSTWVVL